MTIHEYLSQRLSKEWNMVRLKTLVGSPFLRGIGDELESLVNKQFTVKQLDREYLKVKKISNITESDIVATFIFNMSQPAFK